MLQWIVKAGARDVAGLADEYDLRVIGLHALDMCVNKRNRSTFMKEKRTRATGVLVAANDEHEGGCNVRACRVGR